MRRPVSTGCDTLPMVDVLEAQRIRRPAMQKISTVQAGGRSIFNADKLTRLYQQPSSTAEFR
jgi:hypothetical protein